MTHEPAQWADLVAHLRDEVASWRMAAQEAELEVAALRKQVSALTDAVARTVEDRKNAHREGYELARDASAKSGLHLVRYDVAMKQAKETE
jgi:hypothetical protein